MANTSQYSILEDDIFQTSKVDHRSSDLEGGRTVVVTDLGPTISQVTFQSFLSILLPFTYDVPKTIQKLEQGGHILQGRWAVFPVDPAKSASLDSGGCNIRSASRTLHEHYQVSLQV